MLVNTGDFVCADVDLPEDYPTRQGIFCNDNTLFVESGKEYEVVEVHAIVKNLWGSTYEFVKKWRQENL